MFKKMKSCDGWHSPASCSTVITLHSLPSCVLMQMCDAPNNNWLFKQFKIRKRSLALTSLCLRFHVWFRVRNVHGHFHVEHQQTGSRGLQLCCLLLFVATVNAKCFLHVSVFTATYQEVTYGWIFFFSKGWKLQNFSRILSKTVHLQ